MATVYLALGSNVGDSHQHIQATTKKLSTILKDLKTAPLYRSRAVGYTDQADFTNTAVSGTTDLSPADLLTALQKIEHEVGRTASFHWGPREIDIDIIFFDEQIIKTSNLTIPHPEFSKRDFVLQPLLNLNPKLVDPISHMTVKEIFNNLKPEQRSIVD